MHGLSHQGSRVCRDSARTGISPATEGLSDVGSTHLGLELCPSYPLCFVVTGIQTLQWSSKQLHRHNLLYPKDIPCVQWNYNAQVGNVYVSSARLDKLLLTGEIVKIYKVT